MKLSTALGALLLLYGGIEFAGAPGETQEVVTAPFYDGSGGVTCRYFNAGARIPWRRAGGDWVDRAGALHGRDAYVRKTIVVGNRVRAIQLDVSDQQ